MPVVNEQWTRGAGGGIGMSDHQNSFQYVLAYMQRYCILGTRCITSKRQKCFPLMSGLVYVLATGSKPEQSAASSHCRLNSMPQRRCAATTAQQ